MSTTTTTPTQTGSISLSSSAKPNLSGPVSADVNYYLPPADGSAPFSYASDPPAGVPRSNYGAETHKVSISDMRGRESDFKLDVHAFQPIPSNPTSRASTADFSSDEAVERTYYPEVERTLLENLPGAPRRVLIFDHTIRRAQSGASREPVLRAHIDQTAAAAKARVQHHLPDEADALLKGRYRLVNVWRPLNGTVESFPLAVGDSTTLSDEALVGIQLIYPDRTGETAGVKFDEGTRWWYWSGMGNEERLLLQCFDSEAGARVPHTAFKDERAGEGAKPRESIEVRALIFG